MKPWKRISGRLVQRTRIFDLQSEVYVSPRTGEQLEATIVEAPDWVNTIALRTLEDTLGKFFNYPLLLVFQGLMM